MLKLVNAWKNLVAVDFSCELDASDEMFDLEETTAHELTEDDLWQPFFTVRA